MCSFVVGREKLQSHYTLFGTDEAAHVSGLFLSATATLLANSDIGVNLAIYVLILLGFGAGLINILQKSNVKVGVLSRPENG